MAINDLLLGQFVPEILSVHSVDKRFEIYGRYVHLLGFDGVSYTFAPSIQFEVIPESSLQVPICFLSTPSFPQGFLEQYQRERLDQHDFTIRKIVVNGETKPMDWQEHVLNGDLTAAEINLILSDWLEKCMESRMRYLFQRCWMRGALLV